MKIGIFFNDSGIYDIDIRNIELGNPGIGGTQYCFAMLIFYLHKYYKTIDIMVYHYNKNIIGNSDRIINDINDLEYWYEKDKIELLIIDSIVIEKSNLVYSKSIKLIVWAHNYLTLSMIEVYFKSNAIKRIVFVSRQMYDYYMDTDLIGKCIYIYNMIPLISLEEPRQFTKTVTYIGALNRSKGFHILARQWKRILDIVPEAQLYVIGSGKLYDRHCKLGNYGIAEESYEKIFMPYLIDDNGKTITSVHFCGILGEDKIKILSRTDVGIINPSGRTETFGLSAVEMEQCSIPIVTYRKKSYPDIIVDGKTGYLVNNKHDFVNKIALLLLDNETNRILGINASGFVKDKFSPEIIIEKWIDTINNVYNDNNKVDFIRADGEFTLSFKWLRIVNRFLRYKLHFKFLPSISEIECVLKNHVRQMINKSKM